MWLPQEKRVCRFKKKQLTSEKIRFEETVKIPINCVRIERNGQRAIMVICLCKSLLIRRLTVSCPLLSFNGCVIAYINWYFRFLRRELYVNKKASNDMFTSALLFFVVAMLLQHAFLFYEKPDSVKPKKPNISLYIT